eukprot:Skav226031  [mRNA]  locus=scaffold2502:67845:73876:+ [translate_table: standard]
MARKRAHTSCVCIDEFVIVVGDIDQLQGNVFTTLQLHKILLAVDNPDSSFRRDKSNVSRSEPTIFAKLCCNQWNCLSARFLLCHSRQNRLSGPCLYKGTASHRCQ